MHRKIKSQLNILGFISTISCLNAATTEGVLLETTGTAQLQPMHPVITRHQGEMTRDEFINEVIKRLECPADGKIKSYEVLSRALTEIYLELSCDLVVSRDLQKKVNSLFTMISLLSTFLDSSITNVIENLALCSEKTRNHYLRTEHPLFLFLQNLTLEVRKKIDVWTQRLNTKSVYKITNGLESFDIDGSKVCSSGVTENIYRDLKGVLYFLKDKNGVVPVFVSDLIIDEARKKGKHVHILPYYGHYKEGFLSRGVLVSVSGNFDRRPGVFIKTSHDKIIITISDGALDSNKPPYVQKLLSLINCTEYLKLQDHKGTERETFIQKYFVMLGGLFSGNFVPFSEIEEAKNVLQILLDCLVFQLNGVSLKRNTMNLITEILTLFADKIHIAEEKRNLANSEVSIKPKPKKKTGRKKGTKINAQKVSPGTASELEMGSSQQPSDDELLYQTAVPVGAQVQEVCDDGVQDIDLNDQEHDQSSHQKDPKDENTEPKQEHQGTMDDTPSDKDDSGTAAEAPQKLSLEVVHRSIYDRIMETVPEGRISQKTLNRLIGDWLSITGIPLECFRVFCKGSHRKVHTQGGGVTLVKRHGRDDRSYAPGEIRALAKNVAALKSET